MAVRSALGAKPGVSTRSQQLTGAGRHVHIGARPCSTVRRASVLQQHRRRQVPICHAASSQLSQEELQELLAENAKLKQLLNTYADRLSPEQVSRLTKQYEEIAALAASAGLQLDPLDIPAGEKPSPPPPAAAAAPAPPAPAAAPEAAAPAAPAVPAEPKPAPAAASSSSSNDGAGSSGGRASRFRKLAEPEPKAVEFGEGAGKATQQKAASKPPAAAAPSSSSSSADKPGSEKEGYHFNWRSGSGGTPPPAAVAAAAPAAQNKSPAAPVQQKPASPAPAAAAATPRPAAAPAAPKTAPGAPAVPPAPAAAALRAAMSAPPKPRPAAPQQQQQRPPVQEFTGPTPTSPLFGSSSSSGSSNGTAYGSSGSRTTAIVDKGPPPPPKVAREDDILDIPDPIEEAKAVVTKMSPQEKAKREAEKQKERAAATELVKFHDPAVIAADRHNWLIFTVPEKPVAGSEVVIYYNRTQSEILRERNRLQVIIGYNQWELAGEPSRVDLYPSPIPHIDGSDFWATRFKIPESAYELNFVVTDGESLFDNNAGQDYTYPCTAGLTYAEWQAAAVERAEAAEKERAAAEAARRAEEAKQIEEDKLKRDRDNATKRVADMRDGFKWMREGGLNKRKVSDDPTSKTLWSAAPTPLVPGKTATLLYNSKAGPLAWIEDKRPANQRTKATPVEGQEVPKVLLGFNNWKIKCDPLPMKHSTLAGEDDELWWEIAFEVPKDALCVNFVVNAGNSWDNNGGKDHKINVALPAGYTAETIGEWAETFFEGFLKEEREARLKLEKETAERDAVRLAKRNEQKEKAKGVLRRQVKHIMFTEPEVIKAGEPVTVYYCPDDTNLSGTSQVYFTGGFNRWSHKRTLGPVMMRPPGTNGRHWQVRFSVPKDALQLDFVFSNVPGGDGIYDNRGGFDYHLPIKGGVGSMPGRLHVAHIAVEMAPIAKVGGLGDVVTALGRAVQEEGHLVEVILPRYNFFLNSPLLVGQMRYETEFDWGGTRIFVSTAIVEGLRCFFIEPRNGFFDTPTVYGRYDDEVRFDFFCKAALEFLLKTGRQPDILHCHDWSTAHVAKSFWEDYQPYGLWKPKVVFTIHNMNYGQKKISEAAYYCQKFTTVSPTYAFEVGSHPAIAGQTHKFMGIRNGIDAELWSPEDNKFLPITYDADTAEEGKRRAREELRKRVNMSNWNDKCIIAVVSRLTPQKGVHLIKHAAYKAIERGCQFVLLGSAPDPKVQEEFNALANEVGHGQDAGFVFTYDEPLSHLIYAAADVILVPSMFEPCGLTQMIAMRYGAVPVVRHTGGLRDTVFDVDNDKPRAAWEVAGSSDWIRDKVDETNGFAFEGMDEGGLDYALNRCIDAYYNDRAWFRSLQQRVMRQDWSWNRPALDYVELYYSSHK